MIIEKTARPTLAAVELDAGDELHFTLADGATRRIRLEGTSAGIFETNLEETGKGRPGGFTHYRMFFRLTIDGVSFILGREVGTQRSFYAPREIMGLRIWPDACENIFEFLTEDHGRCRPSKQARFAVQDASLGICPTLLHPWCPLPAGGLQIEDCYNADDCWLGAYFGSEAHGGLDINHPAGTPLWAPLRIDEHELYDRLEDGANNNRWRGLHHWPDGSTWVLRCAHLIRLRAEEGKPVAAGALLADGAGVRIGSHEHSHFIFAVREPGAAEDEEILLDPWILFSQMYADRRRTTAQPPAGCA